MLNSLKKKSNKSQDIKAPIQSNEVLSSKSEQQELVESRESYFKALWIILLCSYVEKPRYRPSLQENINRSHV